MEQISNREWISAQSIETTRNSEEQFAILLCNSLALCSNRVTINYFALFYLFLNLLFMCAREIGEHAAREIGGTERELFAYETTIVILCNIWQKISLRNLMPCTVHQPPCVYCIHSMRYDTMASMPHFSRTNSDDTTLCSFHKITNERKKNNIFLSLILLWLWFYLIAR